METINTITRGQHEIVLCGRRSTEARQDLLLIHGMAEHHGRYDDFCKAMAREKIDVTVYDQRGHGQRAADAGALGYGAPFETLVDDALAAIEAIAREKGRKPYLMGHSMGSFVALSVALKAPESIGGLILSGTGYYQKSELLGGRIFAAAAMALGRKEAPATKLHRMTFGKFAAAFPEAQTSFDWLSSDREVVDAYIEDPLCGFVPTYGFYHFFFNGLDRLLYEQLPAGFSEPVKVFMISGNLDPVGNFSKGFFEMYHRVKEAGAKVNYQLYDHGRHEVLNESNRHEVYGDLVRWLHDHE
jgi:alpha-beta hydrolase superfamily lysophospholipase